MGRYKRIAHSTPTEDEVVAALNETFGLAAAGRKVGLSYDQLRVMMQSGSTAILDAVDAQRTRLADLAQERLAEKVESGDIRAVELTLRTLGRDMGYSERKEITGVIEHVFDHARAVATVTGRSEPYRLPPGTREGSGDGASLGQDIYGGDIRSRVGGPGSRGSLGSPDIPERADIVAIHREGSGADEGSGAEQQGRDGDDVPLGRPAGNILSRSGRGASWRSL